MRRGQGEPVLFLFALAKRMCANLCKITPAERLTKYKKTIIIKLGQHRTKLVRKVRCQIFRQIAWKFRRHTAVWQGISGQYDGKSAHRLRAKPSGGLCAVLP